jgi:hypothetical protein
LVRRADGSGYDILNSKVVAVAGEGKNWTPDGKGIICEDCPLQSAPSAKLSPGGDDAEVVESALTTPGEVAIIMPIPMAAPRAPTLPM